MPERFTAEWRRVARRRDLSDFTALNEAVTAARANAREELRARWVADDAERAKPIAPHIERLLPQVARALRDDDAWRGSYQESARRLHRRSDSLVTATAAARYGDQEVEGSVCRSHQTRPATRFR